MTLALFLFVGIVGCEKEEDIPNYCNCEGETSYLRDFENYEGTVRYNPKVRKWCIYCVVPNAIDGETVFMVCGMPKRYAYNGMRVIFSGKEFHYSPKLKFETPIDTDYACLKLTSIQKLK